MEGRMRDFLLATAMGVLVALGAPVAAAAAPIDQATGSAKNTHGDQMNISAEGVLSDARGRVTLDYSSVFGPQRVKGDVTCVNVVGNRAAVEGRLSEQLRASPGFDYFFLLLEDNGNGKHDPPDKFLQGVTDFVVTSDCGMSIFDSLDTYPVTHGNIELKNRTSP
jgi:hypothetical protein